MTQQKTYWHLQELGRKPTGYEVVTSKLLYHPVRGFEVKVPVEAWYERYQKGSPLRCSDWEQVRDPRETTYARYTDTQQAKEIFVDGLLRLIDETRYDGGLAPAWVAVLARVLAPLRYPVHGLQMIAAYVGHMAPSGRITVAALFQTADEIRRLHRLAYRMRQLQQTHPGFGDDGKAAWERDPLWQPLRKVVERLLVTYDWGEALIALNLVLKPMLDELLMTHFGRLAALCGDEVLAKIFRSLGEDCAWHRDWTRDLVRTALTNTPANETVLEAWIARWRPPVTEAVAAFAPVFDATPEVGGRLAFEEVAGRIDAVCHEYWASAGLREPAACSAAGPTGWCR